MTERLGRYVLLQEIGRGGMGVVHLAEDSLLGRRVALKVLAEDLAGDTEFARRFTREVRIAAGLEHPHVVAVHDAGEVDGRLFLAMPFIEGEDLRRAIARDAPLEPARVARLGRQLGGALDAAHARGLVHRDVKPGNVLLTGSGDEEHLYLADFGLAREAASDSGLTHTGQWLGTVDYVAPEQLEGDGLISARSDVYAMACLLFQALTGRVPFSGSIARKLAGHARDPLPSVGAEVPRALVIDAVLRRGAAKDPADRHPSAGDLGRALAAAVDGGAVDEPERTVATGVALTGISTVALEPDERPTAAAAVAAPAARVPRAPRREPRPAAAPAPAASSSEPRRARSSGSVALAGVAAIAVLALAGAVLLLAGRGGEGPPSATAAGEAPTRTVAVTQTVTSEAPEDEPAPSPETPTTPDDGGTTPASRPAVDALSEPGRYVQLASFRTARKAEALAGELRAAGVPAAVYASGTAQELLPGFRVVAAGPVTSESEGRRLVGAARGAGVADAFVRPLTPADGPADPPALEGTWSAKAEQRSASRPALDKTIPTTVTFEPGGRSATVRTDDPDCSGTLTHLESEGAVMTFAEDISSGDCLDGGRWQITRPDPGELAATWRTAGRDIVVTGRFRR